MRIRDLTIDDAEDLLRFEFTNRAWFEQHIAPRPDSFFNLVAVQDHIRGYLNARELKQFHACVITDEQGIIVGRANLREISIKLSSAEVGYRIAESHSGLGLASMATKHLLDLAYNNWRLSKIFAYVTVANHASSRVLAKNGFVEIGRHPRITKLKHGAFDCIQYQHLPNPTKPNA